MSFSPKVKSSNQLMHFSFFGEVKMYIINLFMGETQFFLPSYFLFFKVVMSHEEVYLNRSK